MPGRTVVSHMAEPCSHMRQNCGLTHGRAVVLHMAKPCSHMRQNCGLTHGRTMLSHVAELWSYTCPITSHVQATMDGAEEQRKETDVEEEEG